MNINRQQIKPLNVPRTRRVHPLPVLTSMPAGKFVPVAMIPMLREDSLVGDVSILCEMQETYELLANPVNLHVTAYCVPLSAMERFEGSRDQFDRSYMGEPQINGGDVIPFIETHAMGTHGANAVYKALGLHGKSTDEVNTAYLEAYNKVWNFIAKNRSMDLDERGRLDTTLAPAFWRNGRFADVVPDFDAAMIDGQVPLTIINPEVAIRGTSAVSGYNPDRGRIKAFRTDDPTNPFDFVQSTASDAVRTTTVNATGVSKMVNPYLDLTQVYAELEQDGITVSLANIEQARKSQAFARLRQRYEGLDDEYLIDMLMSGLSVPDQWLMQPFMVGRADITFGQVKRYATDSGNLAESAVSGGAAGRLHLRVPRLATGGVVVICVEAIPEQLFERQRDPFFHLSDARDEVGTLKGLPDYQRDELDPQKVDELFNRDVDTDHATPTGTFGYVPTNWKWTSFGPKVGGKFYRPTTNTIEDEERLRIWAVEAVNPVLSEDFYIVSEMHVKPFIDQVGDPFEIKLSGGAVLEGNTVFGPLLPEANNNYDKVMEKAPTEQIEQPA